MLFRQLRADIALHASTFQAAHDLFLFSAERVHGSLSGLGTRRRIADCLPPELRQLRIIRNIGAGRRPLNAGRRAIELDKTTELGGPVREALVMDGTVTNEGETDVALLHIHGL